MGILDFSHARDEARISISVGRDGNGTSGNEYCLTQFIAFSETTVEETNVDAAAIISAAYSLPCLGNRSLGIYELVNKAVGTLSTVRLNSASFRCS